MKRHLLCVLSALLFVLPLSAQDFNVQFRSKVTFTGQTLANIAGYTQNGREYALVGGSKGLIIVEITDPENPVTIIQIPGPDNLWKEIKTYGNYAYITSEGGGGVQIVDLSNLPSDNLAYHNYLGDGAIAGQLNTIHALHIDVTKGFLYAFGSNLFQGGAVVLDLNADPYNPVYAGKYDQLGYIHDGFADNDTLYAGHIYSGTLAIVDMTDKQAPQVLGSVQTPGKFTHNAWLTDDHRHILTTDETTPSFLTAFDITDPTDIRELDRYSPNDGYGSIGHNTHVLNDWAVTSWYSDGFTIVDAHRPENLVVTGQYDTWGGTGANFNGCWGVYPFFPSGTIIASNIQPGELFILTPQYVRACYLEGTVTNACDGLPLSGVSIEVNSGAPQVNTTTKADGSFKTGQATPGVYTVTISKSGYLPQNIDVNFTPGEVFEIDVDLEPVSAFTVAGTIIDGATGQPIPNASVVLSSPEISYTLQTDGNGQFQVDCALGGDYEVLAGGWGYLPAWPVQVNSNEPLVIELESGYYDDFALDYGWQTTSTASAGLWTRGIPVGTTYQGNASNPGFDVPWDQNDRCYVTGNGGGQSGADDVDNGSVTLTSPVMQLAAYEDAVLTYFYWFFNAGGQGTPNDAFEVWVSNGIENVNLLTETTSQSTWRPSGEIHLKDYITLTDNMRVRFIATDDDPGHLVEGGVDIFRVIPGPLVSSAPTLDAAASVSVAPNPTADQFRLRYDWDVQDELFLDVRNLLGQRVIGRALQANQGTLDFGSELQPGVYILTLRAGNRQALPLKIVKQ